MRRDGVGAPAMNAWGGGAGAALEDGAQAEGEEESGKGKKKGNKGKKQVLMNWG